MLGIPEVGVIKGLYSLCYQNKTGFFQFFHVNWKKPHRILNEITEKKNQWCFLRLILVDQLRQWMHFHCIAFQKEGRW